MISQLNIIGQFLGEFTQNNILQIRRVKNILHLTQESNYQN